jgi:DNA-binding CsgD family transcriptional regulator
VTALARGDAERLLRFVAGAEEVSDDMPFTGDFLVELGRLVQADWVTYCELDRVRKRLLLNIDRTGDVDDLAAAPDESVFWEVVLDQHPVCAQHQRGDFRALKISDFLTPAKFKASLLYDLWFRPYHLEHEMSVPIPSPLWHTKTFLFDREGTRDFTERDRLVLDLLQPHLARLWKAARTRRLLGAALARLDSEAEQDASGVVLLDGTERIEFASAPARRLLHEFFAPEAGGRLPKELAGWLESGGTKPFQQRRDTYLLTVERNNGALLLVERRDEVRLTPREKEVLSWVARGKTNAEIARLLWVSPGTVRKHLENVYAKLGVSTRTAAAARFLGLLDAEAS